MRYLPYIVLGFSLACGLGAYGVEERWYFPAMGLLLLLCVFPARERKALRSMLVILGCLAGLFWCRQYSGWYLRPLANLDGQTRTIVIRVMDYSEETAYGMAFDGRITVDGKHYRLRAYVDAGEPLEPGMTVTGPFRLRLTAPGATEESRYYQSKGIFLLSYQEGDAVVCPSPPGKEDIPAILRRSIRQTLDESFPADTASFAKALLLGDTSDLSYKTDTDLKVSGIRHVVAVSGLHVSILFSLLRYVAFRNRWLMTLAGIPGLFVFAAVAGFSPSVNRACLMCALMLLAMVVNREYDGPSALAFAVLVLLFANPLSVTDGGFQLSVASVSGIFLFSSGIRSWILSRFPESGRKSWKKAAADWISSSVSVSLSAMVLTTPLCACYFGTVSLIAPLTNLLTLWVIQFVFYGIMGICLVSQVWSGGALVLAKVVSVPVRYVLAVAHLHAKLPLAAVYTESVYIAAWLIFVYCLLAVFCSGRRKRPVLLTSCAVFGLCAALVASWAEPLTDDVRFTVLDVGQGQCLLLQAEGKTVMIDCGGDSDAVAADKAAEFLLSQGISGLDVLILTHTDRDHAGGAENLLSRMDTRLLILPPVRSGLAQAAGGRVVYAAEDLELSFGDVQLRLFVPTFPGNSNEMSLCILLDTKKCDILVTGDRSAFGERALLRNTDLPHVDILVAGHHGAKGSTCEELLTAVCPQIVCISAGKDNSYGHPAPELLTRLADYGCAVYRTDIHGTIIIRR